MAKLIVELPDELLDTFRVGLSQRGGWKPSKDKPDVPEPMPATSAQQRAHPTYSREERPILGQDGQPQGTQILETWQPTRGELALLIAEQILWSEARRGQLESLQEQMDARKKAADEASAIIITIE